MKLFILILTLIFSSAIFSYSDDKKEKDLIIIQGDSKDVVRSKWGSPAQVDRSMRDGVGHEVWIYTCEYLTPCVGDCDWYYDLPCYYLLFENGELQSWQDVR